MRCGFAFAAVSAVLFGASLRADPIVTFTLDSSVGYGASAGNPDPNTCLQPNCVSFVGTLTYVGDPDDSAGTYSDALVSFPYTTDQPNFGNTLTLDTYSSPPGLMSDDPNWANDGDAPNTYYGPVFEVDIPAGTPNGVYQDIVYFDFTNLNTGNTTTVSQSAAVIIPEPSGALLMFAGLLSIAGWRGVTRTWRSGE